MKNYIKKGWISLLNFNPFIISISLLFITIIAFYENIWEICIIDIALIVLFLFFNKKNWIAYLLNIIFLIWIIINYFITKSNFEIGQNINKIAYIQKVSSNYILIKIKNSLFYVSTYNNNFVIGQKIKIVGTINNLNQTKNFYNFDFDEYLKNIGVNQQIDNVNIEILNSTNIILKFNYFANNFNNDLIQWFIFDKTSDFTNEFSNLGISYVLNLSGMNIFIIVILINKVLKKVKYSKYIKLVIHLGLMFYLYLLSFPLVLTRVIIGLIINNIFKITNHKIDKQTKKCLILFLLFLFQPLYFKSESFYFILLTFIFIKPIKNRNWIKEIFINILISIIIFIPMQVYFNYRWNIFSAIFQMLLTPLLSLTFILVVLFWWIPNICLFFNVLQDILLSCVKILEKINISWNIGKFPLILLFVYYIILWITFRTFYNKNKYFKFLILVDITIVLLIAFWMKIILPNNILIMMNIGNGNSLLYVNKLKNIVMFFDAGNGIGFSESNEADLLKYLGINHVDIIFVSHNHTDHYNGIENIKQIANVKNVIWRTEETSEWHLKGIDIFSWKLINQSDENDNSRIILLSYNGTNILFTGDLTMVGEKQIMQQQEFVDKMQSTNIDLLIVGHHGSKTSTSDEWVKLIKPKYAFISGMKKGNRQFPNDETIETLNNNSIPYWVTNGICNWVFKLDNNLIYQMKK